MKMTTMVTMAMPILMALIMITRMSVGNSTNLNYNHSICPSTVSYVMVDAIPLPKSIWNQCQHLGCLYHYRPFLFATPGEIYCAPCHSDCSTAILEKYFEKVDYERSHFICSRAYVVALLEKHVGQNPKGNVIVVDEDGGGDNVVAVGGIGIDGENPNNSNGDDNESSMNWGDTAILSRCRSQRLRQLLKNSPRSELWYPHELQAQIMLPNDDQGGESLAAMDKSIDDSMINGDSEIADITTSASFLVGKPTRLYNNLDNEYHVGRIVDWRKWRRCEQLRDVRWSHVSWKACIGAGRW